MLQTLRIKNFAIVDSLEIDGRPGLTAFTGETGAGKTVIVEALRLLLGGRSSSEMIRTGCDTAVVEGCFTGTPESSRPAGPFWLRREISRNGKSRAFLDDRQITRDALRSIGANLADLCGQHQQQRLLDPGGHLRMLDEYAGTVEVVAAVESIWTELATKSAQLAALQSEVALLREQEELRRFQIDEIRRADVRSNEEEHLKSEATILRNARRLTETADRVVSSLCGDEESVEHVLSRLLRDANRSAEVDDRWNGMVESLISARDSVEHTSQAAAHYRDSLEFDPGRAEEIEARLAELFRLKSKYGDSCDAILARLTELESEQHSAGQGEAGIRRLHEEVLKTEQRFIVLADALSGKRRSAAVRLEKEINSVLGDVGMKDARVRADIQPRTSGGRRVVRNGDAVWIHSDGADEVSFMFEANPREGFKPLHRIASGGELSRLLLAFKSVTVAENDQRLYVFDEIDSGIGGHTASLVAQRISALAKNAQVFLISHLQQMAAPADQHLVIEKQMSRGRARVRIRELEGEDRVRELARMVAGEDVTDRTLEFASELAGNRRAHDSD